MAGKMMELQKYIGIGKPELQRREDHRNGITESFRGNGTTLRAPNEEARCW